MLEENRGVCHHAIVVPPASGGTGASPWVHETHARREAGVVESDRTMIDELLRARRRQIRRIARAHGVRSVRLFGSRGRGSAHAGSDLDLLVSLAPGRDLLDLAEFKLELQDLLGLEVDVVTARGLSPYLRRGILSAARPL